MGGMKVGERANAELMGDALEEGRSFLELLRAERVIDTQSYRRRLDQISCAAVRRGHYRMESSELEHASTTTAPGYRERAESELNPPNYAGVGTTTVGPIRRKGSS